MDKWCQKEIAEMIEAIAKCNSPEEVCEIFDRILTPREINDMARRYKILQMLKEGKNYFDIGALLGVSNDMISRVSTNMGYGFRRAYSEPGNESHEGGPKRKPGRLSVKYKGSPSITEIIFPRE